MAFDDFKEKLKNPESQEHDALLRHVKGLIAVSRRTMGGYYSKWDYNDSIFRSEKKADKEDRSAAAKGKPTKMIVPLTFSQVMTFVAFCVTTTTQNKRFFELEPTGSEDNPLREPMELILERDIRRNQWTSFLVQFFLDIGRFSLAAAEVCYKEEYRHVRITETKQVPGPMGETQEQTKSSFQQIPTFVGNKVYPISPYRFFPDTRLPLTRYQEGEFCGSEDMFSVSSLRGDSACFNLDKIPKMTEDEHKKRQDISRIDVLETRARGQGGDGATATADGDMVKDGMVVLTKVVCDIIPKHFKVDDKTPLGDEEFPIRYIVWYANDKTIVRFEEAYYLHGLFPYVCGQFLPDQHKTVNEGLSDVCDQITNLITWLINAHITSVRSNIDSKFIVDPAGVDMKSLESRSPYIFLKKNASQTGVDRYIKQFQTTDPTAAFMDDAARLKDLLEVVTGFTGNMQGQYASGRRSATESRVVTQGASARGKTTLGGIWDTAFEPLGRQLIVNNRQEMERDTFNRVLGTAATDELWVLFKADPISIATNEDFFVFDATLPSEKAFLAQSLQEILMTMLGNPEVAMAMGYGPEQFRQIFDDVYNLRGVTNSRLPARGLSTPGAAAPVPPPQVVPMPGVA